MLSRFGEQEGSSLMLNKNWFCPMLAHLCHRVCLKWSIHSIGGGGGRGEEGILSEDIPLMEFIYLVFTREAGTACWLERRTRDRKVASSNSGRSGGRIFFSRANFVCWLLFGVGSTPVLPQGHVKDPGHSANGAGGRLHLKTHTPSTQRSRSGLTMPLSRHSVGTCPETHSHATCQETFGHSRLNPLSRCGLILA